MSFKPEVLGTPQQPRSWSRHPVGAWKIVSAPDGSAAALAAPVALQKPTAPNAADDPDKRAHDAAKVGRDFEAIFVRQMLTQTKVAGQGGYADMAVESLATSITSAGGLGMGRAIEDSLLRAGHHPEAPPQGVNNSKLQDSSKAQPTGSHVTEKAKIPPQVPAGGAVRIIAE
jgi:Rod binding domain-containing protein